MAAGCDCKSVPSNSRSLRTRRASSAPAGLLSLGLRRHFSVVSSTGGALFSHAYWTNQGDDFFRWLATRARDPDWRATMGRRWSDGVPAPVLRGA